MRRTVVTLAPFALACIFATGPARAQAPAPNDWRAMNYVDLQFPTQDKTSFAELWADELKRNDETYVAKGDKRFVVGHAPAVEAHLVIRSPVKVVVVSILNTATGCSQIAADPAGGAIFKRCPMRLAIYEKGTATFLSAGNGCFLELTALPAGQQRDPARNAVYGAYDPATRTIKIAAMRASQPYDDCITKIPVRRSS
jgi:hypothetical protein